MDWGELEIVLREIRREFVRKQYRTDASGRYQKRCGWGSGLGAAFTRECAARKPIWWNPLRRAALLHRFCGQRGSRRSGGIRCMKADEDFVRGVLQTGIRLMQLTSRLARKLTKLIAIGHMRECPKNQIRAHFRFSFTITARPELRWRRQCSRQPFYLTAFLPFQGFRRTPLVRSSYNLMRFRTMRNQLVLLVPNPTRAEVIPGPPDRL
jgi:hypothetical protein